jgi:hypothetical protein
MMRYQLKKDLSCCEVQSDLIFLDVAQDRYFRLKGPLEEAMRRFLAQDDVDSALLDELAARGILIDRVDPVAHPTAVEIGRPSHSAIEQATVTDLHLTAATVFEVQAIVWWTRRKLKTQALKTNLDEACAYRARKADLSMITAPSPYEESLLRAAWQFARSRRYVPIAPVCLLDSLSLLWFLSRRGLAAEIVFGVTSEPFAAHCWVQAGDVVLNETLSDANAHTPIRKV